MTTSMLDRARASAQAMGLTNVELHESLIEDIPLAADSVDVVISNGVIDLVPDKEAVFAEIDRVLRPGGRLQLADVFIRGASASPASPGSRAGRTFTRLGLPLELGGA
jgi:arsenite methyltransferase